MVYDADEPEWLRWNYATVVWGIATAHERYHPQALRGADLDRYYGEFVKVGEALGGTDLPATKAEVLDYLESALPTLALTYIAASRTWPNVREGALSCDHLEYLSAAGIADHEADAALVPTA